VAAGGLYRPDEILGGRADLLRAYRDAGFLDAKVLAGTRWNDRRGTCLVECTISEGKRYTVDSVRLEGLEGVAPYLLTRELEFETGEYVSLGALARSQRKLYDTRLFRSASIKPVPVADTTAARKDVLVTVGEEEPGKFEVAGGYGTVERFRGRAEVSYDNTFGRGYRTSLSGKVSSIEESIETSIDDPWIFGVPVGVNLTLAAARRSEPSYRIRAIGAEVNVYKKFLRRSKFFVTPSITFGVIDHLRYSFLELDGNSGDLTPDEIAILDLLFADLKFSLNQAGVSATLVYDFRDNLFEPTSGWYLDLSAGFLYGDVVLDYQDISLIHSVNRIVRTGATASWFASVDDATTVASSIDAGVIVDLSGDELSFLIDDLFYAGGPAGLRGFAYKKVGPLSETRSPLGGELKLVWNVVEVRRRIIPLLGVVAFFDAGTVWEKPSDFRLMDVRLSPGFGLRVNSPIGIVRLDYGFNPWPEPGEANGWFWFGIGHAF